MSAISPSTVPAPPSPVADPQLHLGSDLIVEEHQQPQRSSSSSLSSADGAGGTGHATVQMPAVEKQPLLFTSLGHIETQVPARLDRLPWSSWHYLVVSALGITWLLDGLEVTIVGVLGAVLTKSYGLNLTEFEVDLTGSGYIAGACTGALVFGFLSDRIGRKKLYMVTPSIYLTATLGCAFATNFWMLLALRMITGFGIGGEYAAMNSAIQEFIPARVRGTVSLVINGSFWVGAASGALVSLFFLDPRFVPASIGWRCCFALGGILGVIILIMRRFLPESPRWLLTRGFVAEAEEIAASIERKVYPAGIPPPPEHSTKVHRRPPVRLKDIARVLFVQYPSRSFLGLCLMLAQAFFYNAIFFTYAQVLHIFYDVDEKSVGLFLIPFSVGNFFGPVLLGPLFDSLGRKNMITATYTVSGLLLLVTGALFYNRMLNAVTQTLMWSVIFFFSSPAASSAYLTVSEVFPMEVRAVAIAVFYSAGTGIGGICGPLLFGYFLKQSKDDKNPWHLMVGYIIGASLMLFAAFIEVIFGVNAENKSLEDIAQPMATGEEAAAATNADVPASSSFSAVPAAAADTEVVVGQPATAFPVTGLHGRKHTSNPAPKSKGYGTFVDTDSPRHTRVPSYVHVSSGSPGSPSATAVRASHAGRAGEKSVEVSVSDTGGRSTPRSAEP